MTESAQAAREAEFAIAETILLSVSKTIETTDKFSTWLLAGSGAAAALIVGNLDRLLTVLGVGELRAVLLLLALSLLLGFAQKAVAWAALNNRNVSEAVKTQLLEILAAHEESNASGGHAETPIDFGRAIALLAPGVPRAFHWAWNYAVKRGATDRLSGAKMLSRLCSYQWLLCFFQCVTSFSALIVATLLFD